MIRGNKKEASIAYVLSFVIGSVFGMIPFSYFLGRLKGVDLKAAGSGNIGATNLGRSLGTPFFIIGFVLDALKGLVPVLLARHLGLVPALAGAGAIAGHIFNPFFGFRGGKGVSTVIGVALGLTARSFLIGVAVWLAVYLATFIVSLASICLAIALPVIIIIMKESDIMARILMTALCLMIIAAHHKNIRRLVKGQEPKTVFWKRK